jgi:hypothetical protein
MRALSRTASTIALPLSRWQLINSKLRSLGNSTVSNTVCKVRTDDLLTIRVLSCGTEFPHSVLADRRQLPIPPKAHALTEQHAQLLVLQRAHPATTERSMPILAVHLRCSRRRPLALETAHEETRRDDAVAWDTRRERVVAQCAADGARRARAERGVYVLVGRYVARGDPPYQVVYRPVVWRDALAGLCAERFALGECQRIVDVTYKR